MTQRNVAAMIPVNLREGGVGLPSRVGDLFAGQTVLAHAVMRAQKIVGVQRVVLVHDPVDEADDIRALLVGVDQTDVECVGAIEPESFHDCRQASRKWALSAWRGGLGGATCYDELLVGQALSDAAEQVGIESLVLVGGDWPLHDPGLSSDVLAIHLQEPEQTKLTFCQAPPGLAGVAMSVGLLRELAQTQGTIGLLLGYSPRCPQGDPIGKDVCSPIAHAIRNLPHRLIYDTTESVARLQAIASRLDVASADALAVVSAVNGLDELAESSCNFRTLPQHVTIEITPRRDVDGPITPHHYMTFDRPDMDVDLAKRVMEQLAEAGSDVTVMIGGLGDALLHPHWRDIVQASINAGVFAVGIETDLRCDRETINDLLEFPIDLLSVRLNADTASTYAAVMGRDDFSDHVVANLEYLINERNRRGKNDPSRVGLPWIVPRLIKTEQTLADMEHFYDRWVHFLGHAMVDPSTPGRGVPKMVPETGGVTTDRGSVPLAVLMPRLAPVSMAPPMRRGCRQLAQRMTIHSDGIVARCDQDWQAHAAAGDIKLQTIDSVWHSLHELHKIHQAGQFDGLSICTDCDQWHRP